MDVAARRMPFLCMFTVLVWQSNGECIQSAASFNSSEKDILNNMNKSTCMTLKGKSNDTDLVIKKLQVNKTCIHGPDVNVMAFLSGRQDCSQQTILFVNKEGSDCSIEIRCQSEKGIPYSSNDTICLLKCPKVETSGETYGFDLISGYQTQSLCGLQIYQVEWIAPNGWIGPSPALYWSFDIPELLTVMEGTQQSNFAPLVSGKVNSAVSLDRTKSQWIDLGIHTEACMTRPETCGAAGGAISLWVNVTDCPDLAGIVSSLGPGTGSVIFCYEEDIRFYVLLQDGYFLVSYPKPSGWTQVVGNYIGSNDSEGSRMFINGQEEAGHTTRSGGSRSGGDGRIVVGRQFTDQDDSYTSVQVDELIYFNAALTSDEVLSVYNSA